MSTFGIKEDNKCKSPVLALADILDTLYPVGTLYMSMNSISPEDLLGGTWEKLEGYYLRCANSTFQAGATGGQTSINYTPVGTVNSHKLTVEELPRHTHQLEGSSAHNYYTPIDSGYKTERGSDETEWTFESERLRDITSGATGGNQGHSHTFTGSKTAIPTVPPYITVNVWYRVE